MSLQRISALTFNSGEDNAYFALAMDAANNLAYFATYTSPTIIVKVNTVDNTRVGSLTLNTGENTPRVAFINSGYLYVGCYTTAGRVVKIDLATFTRVGALTFNSGENSIIGGCVDDSGNSYWACNLSPAKIVKVNNNGSGTPTRTGVITLSTNENVPRQMAMDVAGGYFYVTVAQSDVGYAPKIVKIALSTFTRSAAVSLGGGSFYAPPLVIDVSGGYLYAVTNASPAVVSKVSISSFTETGTLTLSTGTGVYNVAIDPAFSKIFIPQSGTPGTITEVDTGSFTETAFLTLDSGENSPSVGIIDDADKLLFVSTAGTPAKSIKITYGVLTVAGVESAATGDSSTATLGDSFSKSAAETAATGDTATFTAAFALSATEGAQTGDSAVGGLAGSTDCQETVATSDAASATHIDSGVRDVSASEMATTGDAASVYVGAADYSKRYWRLIKYDAAAAKDIPTTGLIPKPQYKLMNADTGLTRDFGDAATLFKDAAACVDYTDEFLEKDSAHWPGVYYYPLRVDILPDGRYVELGEAPDAPGYYTEIDEFYIYGGDIVDPTPSSAAQIADAVWDEVLTKATHNIANSAGKILRQLRGMTILEGTAVTGGTNTITLDSGASSVNNIYKEALIVIIAGTAAGEAHHIVSYNGTTKIAVVDQNWYVTPDSTSEYLLFGGSVHDTTESGLAQAGTSTTITFNGTASTADNIYVDQMVYIPSGTGVGQVRRIAGYVGATKIATVDKIWTITPDSTSAYMLYPAAIFSVDVKKMNAYTVTGNGTSGDLWRGA